MAVNFSRVSIGSSSPSVSIDLVFLVPRHYASAGCGPRSPEVSRAD